MTPADFDRFEALAAAATPGPWRERDRYVCAPSGHAITDVRYKNGAADAAYIAALDPVTVQQLIAAARLGAAWEALQETLEAEHEKVCLCPFDGTDPGCNFVMTDATTPALLSLAEALRGRK